jgi:filamentous hemagglutinin family protein
VLASVQALTLSPAQAAPSGPTHDPGSVVVSQLGDVTNVTQTTARAVIDWSSFNIQARETVAFHQPDANSAILNRIHSTSASQIDGALTAPGKVILQNSNGVFFGPGARVDVGSLVATTLQVDRDQFLNSGRLALSGPFNPDAGVYNAGQITAADKGLVALVGAHAANSGVITARLGTVVLASGAAATLDFGGDGLVQFALTDPLTQRPNGAGALVSNSGRIAADGGSVLLSADTAAGLVSQAINLDGVIQARGGSHVGGQVALVGGSSGLVSVADGGVIDVSGASGGSASVTGQSVRLAANARIDASGIAGVGGAIRIGGGYRGQGATPRAQTTTVDAGVTLDASGTAGGGLVVA